MTDIIVIEKNGTIKQSNCKDINELYKSCGFRKAEGFDIQHTWEDISVGGKKYNLSVYARTDGKANTENKYDMPPPIDNALYFGNVAIINQKKNGNLLEISVEEWNKIYEFMFGGFENLEDFDDENEEDELENIPSKLKTKIGGYLKDDFVVDEDEDVGEEEDEDDEEDEDVSYLIDSSDEGNPETNDDEDEDEILGACGSELDYEEYEYSDED